MLGISTPTALSYTDERLHFIVRPFAGAVGVSDVMHGNARQHTDRLTEDYLACETFEAMDLQLRTPDLTKATIFV